MRSLSLATMLLIACFQPEVGDDPAADLAQLQPSNDRDAGSSLDAATATHDGAASCGPLDTPENCGACGHACAGLGLATDDVSCADPSTGRCAMTCRGESYDVDDQPLNGCEVHRLSSAGHQSGTAGLLGSASCDDGTSYNSFTGTIASDSRVHTNPTVDSFNALVGSAPDYWRVYATGGFTCENDYSVTFSTSGGGLNRCYECTILTNRTQSVLASGNDTVFMSAGSGSYASSSYIYFKIEKVCSLPTQELVAYRVTYHL